MGLKYKEDVKLIAKIDEVCDNADMDLLHVLSKLFGAVTVRSMSEWDRAGLRDVITRAAFGAAREMEFAYIDQEVKRSQEATGNLLRVALGCAAIADRTPGDPLSRP